MIAQELEVSLHMAFVEARQQRHEFITVEHLLHALLDNPSANEALRACGARSKTCASLGHFIRDNTPTVQPTLGFQRVIKRAIACTSPPVGRSHRRQRAGGHLRREGFARRVLPAPAGSDAAGRGELHRPRHPQVDGDEPKPPDGSAGTGEAKKRSEAEEGGASGIQFTQNLNQLARRQDRPADRPRPRSSA